MKRIIVPLLTSLVMLWPAAAQDTIPPYRGYTVVDLAQSVSDGDYRGGLVIANTLRSDGLSDDAVDYYRGICLANTGEPKEALAALDAAAAQDTLNAWYCDALITIVTAAGRQERLPELYSRMRRLSPARYSTPEMLCKAAETELRNGRDSAAFDLLQEALLTDPDDCYTLICLAELYRIRGNVPAYVVTIDKIVSSEYNPPDIRAMVLDNTIRSLEPSVIRAWLRQLDVVVRHCAETPPADSSCLKTAGEWFYATGRRDEAVRWFDRYLEACPDLADPYLIRIWLQTSDADHAGAIRTAQELLSRHIAGTDVSAVEGSIADNYLSLGDERNAWRHYDRSLAAEPDNCSTLNNYAYNLAVRGRNLRKAERMSARCVELEPDNAVYLDTYGYILFLQRRYEDARKQFKRAMVFGGKEEEEILRHYSDVLEALGEKDLAAYYRGLAESKRKK